MFGKQPGTRFLADDTRTGKGRCERAKHGRDGAGIPPVDPSVARTRTKQDGVVSEVRVTLLGVCNKGTRKYYFVRYSPCETEAALATPRHPSDLI